MKFVTFTAGMFETNCYIVWCEKTKEAVVIDTSAEANKILNEIKKNQLILKYIINTHGHIDHISVNAEIKQSTGALILIHKDDAWLLDIETQKSDRFAPMLLKIPSPPPDRLLKEGDIIKFGQEHLRVIHTPGHSPGGICLINKGIIFTGDTLFAQGIGRTDFPRGSYDQLITSIKEKLFVLDDNLETYPGHGPSSTIGYEKRYNPFLT